MGGRIRAVSPVILADAAVPGDLTTGAVNRDSGGGVGRHAGEVGPAAILDNVVVVIGVVILGGQEHPSLTRKILCQMM